MGNLRSDDRRRRGADWHEQQSQDSRGIRCGAQVKFIDGSEAKTGRVGKKAKAQKNGSGSVKIVSPAQMSFFKQEQKSVLPSGLNRIWSPSEKEVQKKPEPLPQGHAQDAGMDHHFTSFLQLCNDMSSMITRSARLERYSTRRMRRSWLR